MMSKLNIEVKYSALYRPESIGILERQHRSIKDSLKAAIVDMGEKHQDKWLDILPFVLLGRRVAVQPDLQASASEYALGMNVKIPGQILVEPGQYETEESLQTLLENVRNKTNNPTRQTSRHNKSETELPDLPEGLTHVFTRQHQTTGLQTPYMGPFRVHSRPSRSTFKIEVGTYKDGTKRFEIRHANDLKFAHPKSLASPVERPKLGRPAATTSLTDGQVQTEAKRPVRPDPTPPRSKQTGSVNGNLQQNNHATSTEESRQQASFPAQGGKFKPVISTPPDAEPLRPVRATRNPNPQYVDAISVAPTWTASKRELEEINNSISNRRRATAN